MRNFLKLLATWFNIGRLPVPGTVASAVTLFMAWGLSYAGPLTYMAVTLLMFPVSVIAAQAYEQDATSHDSSEIVIDEVIGMLITLTWMPQTWQAYVAGFFLFRFFDILKPWPIRLLDRKVPGGIGVVIDDVAAGIICNLILQLIYTQTSWLGAQVVSP